MTSLKSMLRLKSFRDSLEAIGTQAVDDMEMVRQSLRSDIAAPSAMTAQEWERAVGAIRIAYEVSLREDVVEVRSDIREYLEDETSEAVLDAISKLLEKDRLADERITGTRQRDSFLPTLVEARMTVDLRMLDDLSESDPIEAAPVVAVRLDFDEHIAGQDAIVFQARSTELQELIDQLNRSLESIKVLERHLQDIRIPRWARVGDPDESRD